MKYKLNQKVYYQDLVNGIYPMIVTGKIIKLPISKDWLSYMVEVVGQFYITGEQRIVMLSEAGLWGNVEDITSADWINLIDESIEANKNMTNLFEETTENNAYINKQLLKERDKFLL